MADLPLNNPNAAFQNNIAATPAPGATAPSPTSPVSFNGAASTATPSTLPPAPSLASPSGLAPQTATTTMPPNQTTPVDVTTLGQPTVNPATLPQNQPYSPPVVPSLAAITAAGNAPTASQGQYDEIGQQIASLTSAEGGQSSDYNALQSQYNVPQLAATANDLTANISQIQSMRDSALQQLSSANKGYGIGSYLDFQNKMTDGELAAKQSAYSATLAAINGQLSTANTYITQAIANKYDPIKSQITALQAQADMVKTTLTSEQNKQLATMQAQLADRTNQINQNKAISTSMLEKIATAAANSANPAPAYIVTQAQNAALSDNPASALSIISPYLNDPLAAQKEIADIQQSKAATASSYADVNLKNAQAAQLANTSSNGMALGTTGSSAIDTTQPGYTTQIVAGGETQASIDQSALSNIIDGKTLNITSRSSPAMRAIANRMGEIAPGGNIQGNKAQLTSLSGSLKQQTEYLNTVQRAFNTANDTLSALQTYMQKNNINPSQFPDYNSFVAFAKAKGIDPGAQGGYNSQIATLRSEYSQVLAKGGVRSVETDNEAKQLIPDNLAPAQLDQVAQQINTDATNVTNDAQKQVSSVQNQINGIIQPTSGSGSTTVMTGPDGKQYNVPNDKVDAFKAAGGH